MKVPPPVPKAEKGPIAWMAGNSVAANLIMAVLLVGGIFMGYYHTKQEVFPEFTLDMVLINIAYPGASPEEVESGIITAVEEAIQDLEGVDEIIATASEGMASIEIQCLEGTDINRFWQEVKSRVDQISTFPDEAEEPSVWIAVGKREVLRLALYGDASESVLRELAEQVQDRLLSAEGITQVEFQGIRDREIIVEISQETLRRYGITLEYVSQQIARASVELGGGSIRASGGDILLRLKDRRDYAKEYARIPIITREDGSMVLLEDLGTVVEGFEESDSWASYNGKKSVLIEVYRVGDQTPIQVSKAGKREVEKINQTLPEGISLTVLRDMSKIFEQRADLLMSNAYIGLALVFFFLALFLEIRLAFWVSMGIPISIFGAFVFLSFTSFSINMISMFAFIVTLGIVVDDAVVVGENVYHYRRQGLSFAKAAVIGAKQIAMPVIFSVITNMVAFLPLMFVPGRMGKIFKTIPFVVIAVFAVSLIESLFILPAHLSHGDQRSLIFPLNYLDRWQKSFSLWFEDMVRKVYGRILTWVLIYRYAVIAFGVALLICMAGYVASGNMGMEMFPKVESDYAYVSATLPYGTPTEDVRRVETRLIRSAEAVIAENGRETLAMGVFSQVQDNTVSARVYLTDPGIRPLSTTRFTEIWRDKTGTIAGLENISFESDRGGPGRGKNLNVSLSHRNKEMLDLAGEDLAKSLAEYPMVNDIDDGSAKGKQQFDISLSPEGKRMGLTSQEVARQIRYAFQGATAVKHQRGKNEITVRVRLPESQRVSPETFEDLVLMAPEGEILLRNAVTIVKGRAYTTISRTDGKREIAVTANVKPASQAENIINDMKQQILPDLVKKFPGLTYSFKGRQADIKESMSFLKLGFQVALVCIFALLAIPFKSYFQPLIIMCCIPFGIIGAVLGHIIMGYSLSIMSMFGLVAMSGVVVNDSLVLIDFANRRTREGWSIKKAVHAAGIQRFRPILLTTLTTCGGLAPIIFETSRQARFLIPMAISLGFGILFATFITLVMVPCFYVILEDIKAIVGKVVGSAVDYLIPKA